MARGGSENDEAKTEQRGFGTRAAKCGRVALKRTSDELRGEEARASALIQCAHRDVVFSTLASMYLFVFGDVCDEDEVHVHAVD